MPLRAKITNPHMGGQRNYSSGGPAIDSLPEDPQDDVMFASKYGVRTIQLNRPDKLNSLNGSMARKIIPRLQEWQKSGMANVIVIKGAGRAFCAGGDVAVLAQDCAKGEEGQQSSKDYFALEYKLDHLIATYQKPYVAFIDGITMGGGVGLSVHAPFRIATEKTVFAMPETTIGFFPDVGASFFLPRMDGGLGVYLALTSERLKGPETYFAGIATHYLHSSSLPDLEARLAELQFGDHVPIKDRMTTIDRTIEEFSTGLPHDLPHYLSPNIRELIDYVFHPKYNLPLPEIMSSLENLTNAKESGLSEEGVEWAKKTIATIRERSPTSVAVTLEMLRRGANWNIAEAFKQEYRIASKFMEHPDFVAGVTARLITKSKARPEWNPNTMDDVNEEETKNFFEAGEGFKELELLNPDPSLQYAQYPYRRLGLPAEKDIHAAFERYSENELNKKGARARSGMTRKEWEEARRALAKRYEVEYEGKIGVGEKVEEVLRRFENEERSEDQERLAQQN